MFFHFIWGGIFRLWPANGNIFSFTKIHILTLSMPALRCTCSWSCWSASVSNCPRVRCFYYSACDTYQLHRVSGVWAGLGSMVAGYPVGTAIAMGWHNMFVLLFISSLAMVFVLLPVARTEYQVQRKKEWRAHKRGNKGKGEEVGAFAGLLLYNSILNRKERGCAHFTIRKTISQYNGHAGAHYILVIMGF